MSCVKDDLREGFNSSSCVAASQHRLSFEKFGFAGIFSAIFRTFHTALQYRARRVKPDSQLATILTILVSVTGSEWYLALVNRKSKLARGS